MTEFANLPRPWPTWIFNFVVLTVLILCWDTFANNLAFHYELAKNPGQLVFFYYWVNFVAFWLVYFLSDTIPFYRTQSLRNFLIRNAQLWNPEAEPSANDREVIDDLRDKARETMTSQALFMAIALLVINELYKTISSMDDVHLFQSWESFLALTGMTLALASFVLLLISFDAIETSFNRFRRDWLRTLIYFNRFSLRPKYYGFIFMLLSLIFYVASVVPNLGAFALALLLSVGYSYWFPTTSEAHVVVTTVSRTFRIALCLFPLSLLFINEAALAAFLQTEIGRFAPELKPPQP